MAPRFDPTTYPGPRPAGPALVWRGQVFAVSATGAARTPLETEPGAAGAPVLDSDRVRWSVAYGSNASPPRLIDKGLDHLGALLLPARVVGWWPAWEARRSAAHGAVPVTLAPAPGATLDTWVLGVHERDLDTLDASEGRGERYLLGHVGEVAVAARWLLPDAPAYGPGGHTRVLAAHGRPVTWPGTDQEAARATVDDPTHVSLAADPLPRTVRGDWPPTPLRDLDLLVYGSLKPGQERWPLVEDVAEVVGPATVRGRLTSTYYGWPAAELAPRDAADAGRVHGVVLRPADAGAAAELYRRCDVIEDHPRLFQRTAVRAHREGGSQWVAAYTWNLDQGPPPGTPVPDGHWTA